VATDPTTRLRERAAAIFEGTPVVFAYLFGSHALGQAGPASDVDVAVFLDPADPPDRRLDRTLELLRRIATSAGVEADLLVLNDAPLRLLGRVLRDRIVVWSRDEPLRVRFEVTQRSLGHDFELHAAPLDRALLAAIAEGRR
jgi:hypothetical protein